MERIGVYLPEPMLAKLREKMAETGYGLSDLIRQYLEKGMQQEKTNA
jgi:metal-responsive CopG/Arc/MetJ family transcriptional regulator